MKLFNNENLNIKDRLTRVTIGLALAMSPLFFTENVALFTAAVFASFYPLVTGLIAIDPVLKVITTIDWKIATAKKKSIRTPHTA